MGYKKDDRCLEKAYNDEKLFVLMARDYTAPLVIMEWIKNNLENQPREKLIEALDCAIEMRRTFQELSRRKQFETSGWIYCQTKFPPEESMCEVMFSDETKGEVAYWSHGEGFQTELNHKVVAWKNARRNG
jgi:hypothetical protein